MTSQKVGYKRSAVMHAFTSVIQGYIVNPQVINNRIMIKEYWQPQILDKRFFKNTQLLLLTH